MDIKGKRIAILATHGFEQSELETPRDRLNAMGARVDIVSPETGAIKGWQGKDWGQPVEVDASLDEARAEDYEALILPGGQINPDLLRIEPKAIALVKAFHEQGKVIAAVCHGPWLLIEAGIVKGRKATSYQSIKTDMVNAGAKWEDAAVVTDQGLVTSRNPGDLEAFTDKIVEEIAEGRHEKRVS